MWADVCGFRKPPDSHERWIERQRGAFSILHQALGIRQTDQSCHHEVWLHMDFVERRNGQAHHERPEERRLLLKERSAPYHYSKQKYQTGKDASDPSLSSKMRRPFATKTGVVSNVDVNTTPTFIDVHMSVHQGHQPLT